MPGTAEAVETEKLESELPVETNETTQADPAAASTSQPTDEPKDGSEDKSKTEGEPQKYELKLPDGSKLKDANIKAIEAFARENKLPPELAQKLLDRESVLLEEQHKEAKSAYDQAVNVWMKSCESDKEIQQLSGGSLKNIPDLVRPILEKYGTAQLKEEMNRTGFGNHPEVVRFFLKLAKATKEDAPPHGGGTHIKPRSLEQIFYPEKSKD